MAFDGQARPLAGRPAPSKVMEANRLSRAQGVKDGRRPPAKAGAKRP